MARSSRSREEWQERILEWEPSSETARAFCERHDLVLSTFRWWCWRLRQDEKNGSSAKAEEPTPWVELSPIELPTKDETSALASDLMLVLGDGIEIRVPIGFDAPTLERLIRTLGVIEC